jgi:hypothetical protein
MLCGHKRHAHMVPLRADGVLPELLGLTRVISEVAVCRTSRLFGAFGLTWAQSDT